MTFAECATQKIEPKKKKKKKEMLPMDRILGMQIS